MALVLSPLYPLAGEAVALSATSTNGASEFAFELTSRPTTSAVTLGLLLTGLATTATRTLSPLLAARSDILGATFTPDVAGEYGIKIYDLVERTAIPSFAGDALSAGDGGYELLATQTGTAHVGGEVRLPLATTQGHGATLVLEVVNETVRAAAFEDSADEMSRQATLVAGVVSALAALVGQSMASIMGDFVARTEDLRAFIDATTGPGHHYATAAGGANFHAFVDSTNVVPVGVAADSAACVAVVNACARSLRAHLVDNGVRASQWHTIDDATNVALAAEASTIGTAQVALSDLRERVYERHRIDAAVHTVTIDNVNELTAPTLFDALVVAFFDELAAASVTAPAGEPEGIADALHLGFTT